jgi:poly-gamma-glutamate synthesis protein (capsule biosynthesis protein)
MQRSYLLLLTNNGDDLQIAMTGDVMLGRLVNSVLSLDMYTYVWCDTLRMLREADLSLINLECVIASKGTEWSRTWKPFHFRAGLEAIEVLKSASIDYVSLANNHTLDYEVEALIEMLELLDSNKIAHSGAGRNLQEAMAPAILESKKTKVAIVSLTDNEPEWEAKTDSPGVNFIPITLENDYGERLKRCIETAKEGADIVIVSCHVGPHFREVPSDAYANFAHQIIELGADIYWGHSNHMPQRIEIYKKKVIMYDCGDFVDDYAVDPHYRNDLSFLFLVNLAKDKIRSVELVPVRISDFRACTAPPWDADFIIQRMVNQCKVLGTETTVKDKTIIIPV